MELHVQIDTTSRGDWDRHCAKFQDHNLYQTWDYAGCTHQGGLRGVSRMLVLRGQVPVAACQFRLKRLPISKIGVAEANWGPLWLSSDSLDRAVVSAVLREIKAEYCQRRTLLVRLEPRPHSPEMADEIREALTAAGFAHVPRARAYRTLVLDLSIGLEALRAGLHGKWRNCLNQSEKAQLEIDVGTGPEYLERFLAVYHLMMEKKRFDTGVPIHALSDFQRAAPGPAKLRVYMARDNDRDVAGGVFSVLGDTVLYYLGAAAPELRKLSNPGYLIQWRSIADAVAAGVRRYDLGGLTDEPNSGVDLFKGRIGGTRVMFPGVFEASSSALATTYPFIERAFRRFRRLVTRRS